MWHHLYIVIHTQWWTIKQKWIRWWNLWFNKIRILNIFSIWILIENIIQLLLMFFLQNFIFLKKFYDPTKNGFHFDLTSSVPKTAWLFENHPENNFIPFLFHQNIILIINFATFGLKFATFWSRHNSTIAIQYWFSDFDTGWGFWGRFGTWFWTWILNNYSSLKNKSHKRWVNLVLPLQSLVFF